MAQVETLSMRDQALCLFSGRRVRDWSVLDRGESDNSHKNSPYVLPYPVGKTYMCSQGRFTGGHNRGRIQYAQDFAMPLRSVVTAARAGRVFHKRENVPENTGSDTVVNEVILFQEDGSYAIYVHLGTNGVFVEVGQ
ncbi:MAG TPA: hypothetical protein VGB38_07320, partial [bacterium]